MFIFARTYTQLELTEHTGLNLDRNNVREVVLLSSAAINNCPIKADSDISAEY